MPSPYTPKPKTKMLPCRYCGISMEVGWKTKKQPAHLECSIRRMNQHNLSMHAKSGDDYARWHARMAAFIASQTPVRGDSPENVFPSPNGDLSRSNGYTSAQVRVRTPRRTLRLSPRVSVRCGVHFCVR